MTTTTMLSPNYTPGHDPIDLLVIHTTESGEIANGAEANARYFSDSSVRASAHVVGDNDSTVRVVLEANTAWTAPGVNARSRNYELVGTAAQSPADWADAYSTNALDLAARQFAEWVTQYGIPIRHITPTEIIAGIKGICGHVDVTNAYHKSTHTDPGPFFPWDKFLSLIRKYAYQAITNSKDDEMTPWLMCATTGDPWYLVTPNGSVRCSSASTPGLTAKFGEPVVIGADMVGRILLVYPTK